MLATVSYSMILFVLFYQNYCITFTLILLAESSFQSLKYTVYSLLLLLYGWSCALQCYWYCKNNVYPTTGLTPVDHYTTTI